MQALLYTDWCAIKKTLVRDLAIIALVVVPVVVASNADATDSPAVMATIMLVVMLAQFVAFGLFGADEQAGWEQMRLCLPITARQVVRGRYAFVALALGALSLAGTLLGCVVEFVLSRTMGLAVPRGLGTIAPAAMGAACAALFFLALEMPLLFSWGLARARLAVTVPFVLVSLVSLAPVHDGLGKLDTWLTHLVDAWGTPAPLFAAGVAFVALVYLASLRLSERLYTGREF